MRRRPLTIACFVAASAMLVPRTLADTRWTASPAATPLVVLTLSVEGLGKRTFLIEPNPEATITLGSAPPRVELQGPILATDPGSTGFQMIFVITAGAGTKVDETKGKYSIKYSSTKDAASALFGFLDNYVRLLDEHLPAPWIGVPIVTSAAKASAKGKAPPPGAACDGKVMVSFSGMTILGKVFKGKMTIVFEQVPPATP